MIPDPDVPNRLLSVNTERYAFFEKLMEQNEFLKAGPGDAGIDQFVMPFDGLFYGFMLYAKRVNLSNRKVCLMVNGSSAGCITLSQQNTPQTQGAFELNIPFNMGDTIQIQDQSNSGNGNARMVRAIAHVRWREAVP